MFRRPFAWEAHVRRELVEDELSRLRELPYSVWREMVGGAARKPVRGRDNRAYHVRTSVTWMRPTSPNLCITVALESPGLRRKLVSQSFVITPDNEFQS